MLYRQRKKKGKIVLKNKYNNGVLLPNGKFIRMKKRDKDLDHLAMRVERKYYDYLYIGPNTIQRALDKNCIVIHNGKILKNFNDEIYPMPITDRQASWFKRHMYHLSPEQLKDLADIFIENERTKWQYIHNFGYKQYAKEFIYG